MDRFRVEVISKTLNPQQVVYGALHQDYSEGFVFDDRESWPAESKCGELIVKRLLAGERGHFGPIEHVQIVFNCGYFPHSVMQQVRTHRVGISFDVQSNRYTGNRIAQAAQGLKDIEDVFYLRPVGHYLDRQGKRYDYTQEMREKDLSWCIEAAKRYQQLLEQGVSEEHARGIIPFDVRQHFVVSFNARSLMHLLDLRAKPDAQLECQKLCDLIMPHFKEWMPELAEWYEKSRLKKARLAP
ncbi:FAD-dependent thymidylate synthase [Microcoleus sp. FACHB-672]|uniref:FAD-dependent thymidylate synthase n=1 Tax=Microcoleus sp. FACHB-672 TaxID=2692825 RepID=UPI001688D699|nr:FAD-dependent thymidylate synthase [Microcoleus sp. FACHB-672]MBD2041795.1 FAD-dependent thymidylate synthase [Microcoleus sp. FACHB-672]